MVCSIFFSYADKKLLEQGNYLVHLEWIFQANPHLFALKKNQSYVLFCFSWYVLLNEIKTCLKQRQEMYVAKLVKQL